MDALSGTPGPSWCRAAAGRLQRMVHVLYSRLLLLASSFPHTTGQRGLRSNARPLPEALRCGRNVLGYPSASPCPLHLVHPRPGPPRACAGRTPPTPLLLAGSNPREYSREPSACAAADAVAIALAARGGPRRCQCAKRRPARMGCRSSGSSRIPAGPLTPLPVAQEWVSAVGSASAREAPYSTPFSQPGAPSISNM